MVRTVDAVAEQWRLTRAQWEPVADANGPFLAPEQFFLTLPALADVLDDRSFLAENHRVMTDIINAAHAVPVLRQLFVSTSLFTLQFSTCAVHPWSDDIPAVEPRQWNMSADRPPGPGYLVRTRPRGDVIGEADDAGSAITLLLAHVPANVGPAGACGHVRHPYSCG